jgi:hypothetical protein
MLRYVGSDDHGALDDLVWSVGGSPPYGGVSYDEAAAVYELIEDYTGPGAAHPASYAKVESRLEPGSRPAVALEIFRCADEVNSAPDTFGPGPVATGLQLARDIGHRGAEASFLSFEAMQHMREGDNATARSLILEALANYLELAEDDAVYTERVRQSAVNAISFTAMTGDLAEARNLLSTLAEVVDASTAEQLRVSLWTS